MKKYNYLAVATMALLLASCGRTINPNKTPKSSLDSFSYALGFQIGESMRAQGLEKLDYSSFAKGIQEAIGKDSGFAIDPKVHESVQRNYVMKEKEKKIKVVQAESKKWLAENAKKPGVTLLPSKGQFKMIKPGTGSTPGTYDTLMYNMTVKNSKGKELWSTKGDPQRSKIPLSMISLPPVQEAFQKVTEGAVFEIYVSNDSYGGMDSRQSLEDSYGISVYHIELLKVIPGKAPEPAKEEAVPPMPEKK